jgi:hypothetical protein
MRLVLLYESEVKGIAALIVKQGEFYVEFCLNSCATRFTYEIHNSHI